MLKTFFSYYFIFLIVYFYYEYKFYARSIIMANNEKCVIALPKEVINVLKRQRDSAANKLHMNMQQLATVAILDKYSKGGDNA